MADAHQPGAGEGEGEGEVIVHRKLVRDRIPEIIVAEGSTPVVRVLALAEYAASLRAKLAEEVQEYLAAAQVADAADDSDDTATVTAAAVEELADLLELLHALAAVHGCSVEELQALQAQKRAARGGFSQRLWLESVQVSRTDGKRSR